MPDSTVIFIIDDDPDDRDFLIDVLKDVDMSFNYFTASNGQDAFRQLASDAIPVPSIIFLDLNMPRINGRQFLTELKKDVVFRLIPVIIYTTSSDPQEIDEMRQLGADYYLVKQSEYLVLREELNAILAMALSPRTG